MKWEVNTNIPCVACNKSIQKHILYATEKAVLIFVCTLFFVRLDILRNVKVHLDIDFETNLHVTPPRAP